MKINQALKERENYSCVLIILFNTALCRSAFSTVSFRKLVFRLSVLSLNQDIKICVIRICSFVLSSFISFIRFVVLQKTRQLISRKSLGPNFWKKKMPHTFFKASFFSKPYQNLCIPNQAIRSSCNEGSNNNFWLAITEL